MKKYVAYYRVSTDRQGRSGLGLDAQRAAVTGFLGGRGDLVQEFTEIESGRKNNRPQLHTALIACRQHQAQLVIAKLDRLARNVTFIANLIESGVEFIACDMPSANRLLLHILAAVAEHEREMISRRIVEALAIARQRGTQLGNPSPAASLIRGRATKARHLAAHYKTIRPTLYKLQSQGLSLRGMGRELNLRRLVTPYGRQWQAGKRGKGGATCGK